jgi:DNA-binding transcriptional LysR family regulator
VQNACEAAGLALDCPLEVDSLGAILQLVQQGTFASILPRIAVRARLAEGALRAHRLNRPALVRQLVCVSHPRRPVAPAAAAFVEVLVRQIREREGG